MLRLVFVHPSTNYLLLSCCNKTFCLIARAKKQHLLMKVLETGVRMLLCVQFVARLGLRFVGKMKILLHLGVISIMCYFITLKRILKNDCLRSIIIYLQSMLWMKLNMDMMTMMLKRVEYSLEWNPFDKYLGLTLL